MKIKPVFESLAKANDNDNLKFAAVNTKQAFDCCQAYKITSIPQFYFYVNGKEVS
jgi:thiol-disulfide isomerase/thioredoxin